MLSREDNELLCRVGPGTPMGALLRQYWIPTLLSNELPEPDGAPVRLRILRECNWFQALEGDIDTSHLGFLHLGAVQPENTTPGTFDYYNVADRAPKYDVVDTEFGTSYGAYRPAEADTYYWRIAHFLFPFFTMIPTGILGVQVLVRAWVPIDDEHVMFWSIGVPRSREGRAGTGGASGLNAAGRA